eukprot:3525344-Rhodomonas_salina.1
MAHTRPVEEARCACKEMQVWWFQASKRASERMTEKTNKHEGVARENWTALQFSSSKLTLRCSHAALPPLLPAPAAADSEKIKQDRKAEQSRAKQSQEQSRAEQRQEQKEIPSVCSTCFHVFHPQIFA